jgi:hypothetical protein
MWWYVDNCPPSYTTKQKDHQKQKYQSIPQPTPYPPTLVGVIQRRRPMVNARLQNFFPRQIAFIA